MKLKRGKKEKNSNWPFVVFCILHPTTSIFLLNWFLLISNCIRLMTSISEVLFVSQTQNWTLRTFLRICVRFRLAIFSICNVYFHVSSFKMCTILTGMLSFFLNMSCSYSLFQVDLNILKERHFHSYIAVSII